MLPTYVRLRKETHGDKVGVGRKYREAGINDEVENYERSEKKICIGAPVGKQKKGSQSSYTAT